MSSTGFWTQPTGGYPAAWDEVTEDQYPFEHEGKFWFIALEGFYSPQIHGPFASVEEAQAEWREFWEYQKDMDAN